MSQNLGRIERPGADQFKGKRKLLLVPLVYAPHIDAEEGQTILNRYWEQMQTQIDALQASLGGLHHIFHESLIEGGAEGLDQLKAADQRSHEFIETKCQAGTELHATESVEFLSQVLDLQRCLMVPFTNAGVATRLQEWLNESNQGRYAHIAQCIDETLQEDETGLLLITERHQVQFPSDIEVFYVAPPALDEFRRWVQNWMNQQQAAATAAAQTAETGAEDETETPPETAGEAADAKDAETASESGSSGN
jgi:hypothetical protein